MKRALIENYRRKYSSLIVFLVIELLLFTSLNLANYGMLFRYLSLLLAASLIPITMLKYQQEEWLNVGLMFVLPLLAYGLFMAVSPLYLILQNVVDNIAMLLSLVSFLLIGVAMAHNDDFHLDRGLGAIFAGLTIILAISLVFTLWRYTFFYVVRFSGMRLYYDGEAYLISNEAKWLFGFEFKEIVTSFFARNAIYLASLAVGLLFIPLKAIKKWDFAWIIAAAMGLLSLFLLPYFPALKFLIPSYALALFVRFVPFTKRVKAGVGYGLIGAGSIFALAALFLILFAFEVPFAENLVANNAIFARVYGNSIVTGYAEVLQASLQHPFGGIHPIIVNNAFLESTGSAFFDTLYQGGIFSALGYLAFLAFSSIYLVRYYKQGHDAMHLKMTLIAFVLTYLVTTLFQYDYAPFVREGLRIYKTPFFSDLNLLLVIFLVGYAFERGRPIRKTKNEAVSAAS